MATLLTNGQVVTAAGLPASIVSTLATAQGDTFSAAANQFISAIVNKIVYQKVEKMQFDNPFKKFDSFPINYGDTIENIFIDMPDGYTFNKDATDPFSKKSPNVKALYATINYEMQYQATIEDSLLRRAALREYGFMEIINSIVAQLRTKMSVDEYLATVGMLNNSNLYADGFETLNLTTFSTKAAQAQEIVKKIQTTIHDFKLPSPDNNALEVMNVSGEDSVVLIIKQSVLDSINMDFLAGVYNLDKVKIGAEIIPVRDFRIGSNTMSGEVPQSATSVGDDLDFVILDKRGFDNHVALQDGGMIYNPKGKYTNHFTNLWKIISFKYWHQARAFKITYPS